MQISIQDSLLSETEPALDRTGQPIIVNLCVLIEDLKERIRCLEEENALLSSRIELLQDLCLAERKGSMVEEPLPLYQDKPNTTQSDPMLVRVLQKNVSLTWEQVLVSILLLIALVTRLWNLGARVMSHDESLHVYYSWLLATGKGFQYNPMMHGPFFI